MKTKVGMLRPIVALVRNMRHTINEQVEGRNWIAGAGVVRVLIVARDFAVSDLIDKALWMWSHHVLGAKSAAQADEMCETIQPDVLVVAADNTDKNLEQIAEVRAVLPSAPIVALGTRPDAADYPELMAAGASAVVHRDIATIPVLNNVLSRMVLGKCDINWPHIFPPPQLPFVWMDSDSVGALTCDTSGKIVDVNQRLASWLGYSSTAALIGKICWRDLLYCVNAWPEWGQITKKMIRLAPVSEIVRGPRNQALRLQIDVFFSGAKATFLHVTLLDETRAHTAQLNPRQHDVSKALSRRRN